MNLLSCIKGSLPLFSTLLRYSDIQYQINCMFEQITAHVLAVRNGESCKKSAFRSLTRKRSCISCISRINRLTLKRCLYYSFSRIYDVLSIHSAISCAVPCT